MTISEYLDSVKERLLLDPLVNNFEILRERTTSIDGYLRVKALLSDGGLLEFAEYIQHNVRNVKRLRRKVLTKPRTGGRKKIEKSIFDSVKG